jgi:hypothetical protein
VKRFIVPCLLVLGGLVASCTETDDLAPRSILEGTFDLTRVGSLVFVTSTDRDELRVLELHEDEVERDFLRAPNPLRPLSIPVLDRPQALARDVSYDRDTPDSEEDTTGREVLGPYVYARSNGSARISVVGATPGTLREMTALSAEGPVTAFAGRGPTNTENQSVLYFATQEATGGRLWRVALVGPDSLNDETPLNIVELKGAGGEPLVPAGESVTSLLVMPQSQGADRLIFSTRGVAGLTGQSFLLTLQVTAAAATATATPLAFGGPVLQLATHGALNVTQDVPNDPVYELPAGKYVFGILDPAACSAQPQCTGVLAVDLDTRQVALDVSGTRMLPIRSLGTGLPMGLTLAPNVDVRLQSGTTANVRNVPLLGIVPLSDGYILFFSVLDYRLIDPDSADAEKKDDRKVVVDLRPFDVDIAAASEKTALKNGVTYLPAAGGSSTVSSIVLRDPNNVLDPADPDSNIPWVTNGVTPNTTYELVYEGVLPNLDNLTRDPPLPDRFRVLEAPAANVQVGDVIVLLSAAQGTACSTDLVVSAVEPPAGGYVTLVTGTAIPPECAGYPVFQVRAKAAKPYVLYGSEGFLGRLGQGDSYERFAPYFFHPETFDPWEERNSEGLSLAVRFRIIGQEPGQARGDRFLVTTLSRYQPFATTIDTVVLGAGAYRVPGAVVQADVNNTDFAYIAYPSANGILQVNLEAITADVPTAGGIRFFE